MKSSKRGQGSSMSMPFGTIFALFLIAVFVIFAFMAIRGFLKTDNSANAGMFFEELQGSVNDAMRSQSSSFEFKIELPRKITAVCFANLSQPITNKGEEYEAIRYYDIYDSNTFLIPPENAADLNRKKIENLDLQKTISKQNPYCVKSGDSVIIKKDFYDKAVTLE